MVNNRIRNVAPATPLAYLHGTDGFTVDVTPTPLPWAHAHFITSDFKFIATNTRIIINKSFKGRIYRVTVQMGAEKASGNPTAIILQLYVNGVAIDCCKTHGAIAAGTHGDATIASMIYVNAGDYIEAYVSVDNGTVTVEADTARIIIEGLHMRGWDNGAGGTELSKVRERRK